ncbi:MAG: DUF6326 family protein [Nanoarchaeota archaeon]
MNTFKKIFGKEYMKAKLSVLWIFVMFNYVYADILTLMDSSVLKELITGSVGGLQITQGFLLAGAILIEIPIAMVVLSLVLKYKANRLANIIAGTIKTTAVFLSMFVGAPTLYYMFFGTIEIVTTSLIVWFAWRWKEK